MIMDILTLIGIIVAIFGIPWYLGRRLQRIENLQVLQGRTINGLLGLVGLISQFLHRRAALNDNEVGQLLKKL